MTPNEPSGSNMIAQTNPSGIVLRTSFAPPRLAHNRRQAGGLGVSPSLFSRAGGWDEAGPATKDEEHSAARDTGGGATRSNLPQDLLRHMQLPPRHIDRVRFKLRRLRPSRRGDHPNRKRLAVQQLLPHSAAARRMKPSVCVPRSAPRYLPAR